MDVLCISGTTHRKRGNHSPAAILTDIRVVQLINGFLLELQACYFPSLVDFQLATDTNQIIPGGLVSRSKWRWARTTARIYFHHLSTKINDGPP